MSAFEELRKEHDVILTITRRMEEAVSGTAGGEPPKPFLLAALEFLRVYADRNHHGKEERALFPIMRENPMLAGLATTLTEEHVDGRRLINAIQQALATTNDEGSVRRSVLDYVQFIRDHIAKENDMIFEVAERELSAGDTAELSRGFADIEIEELGRDGLDRLLAELESASPQGRPASSDARMRR